MLTQCVKVNICCSLLTSALIICSRGIVEEELTPQKEILFSNHRHFIEAQTNQKNLPQYLWPFNYYVKLFRLFRPPIKSSKTWKLLFKRANCSRETLVDPLPPMCYLVLLSQTPSYYLNCPFDTSQTRRACKHFLVNVLLLPWAFVILGKFGDITKFIWYLWVKKLAFFNDHRALQNVTMSICCKKDCCCLVWRRPN